MHLPNKVLVGIISDRAKPTTPPVIFQQLKLMMSDVKNGVDNMNHLDNEATAQRMAKLCVMASMLAYENESVVKDVVTTTWKVYALKMTYDHY